MPTIDMAQGANSILWCGTLLVLCRVQTTLVALADVFDIIQSDRWLTRAWILQERFCSGDLTSTELWFPCDEQHSRCVPGEVCVFVRDQLADAAELVSKLAETHPEVSAWLEAARKRFQDACGTAKPNAMRRLLADSIRAHFNAPTLLRLLVQQDYEVASDNLAILGNSCGWLQRLDTNEAARNSWSFSACAWILALANGDASFTFKTQFAALTQTWGEHIGLRVRGHASRRCSVLAW